MDIPPDNIQHRNVGNVGDVLKHAALVQLCHALRELVDESVYVETHAFMLSAKLPSVVDWHETVATLMANYEGYDSYQEAEAPWVASGDYLCSSGLAIEALRPKTAFLAEVDEQTRAELSSQLAREQLELIATVVAGAEQLPDAVYGTQGAGLMMLVDPFNHPGEVWPTVSKITGQLSRSDLLGGVLVFAYGPGNVEWPDAPRGFRGPVATISQDRYHLAVFGTELFVPTMVSALVRLGWEPNEPVVPHKG